MRTNPHPTLLVLLLVYAAASLVHFVHNAEFIAEYPNLPASWTRADVYLAWLAMTGVGLAGWFLVVRGHWRAGLLVLTAYALIGIESLGHYVLAPLSHHSLAMNGTILLEVAAASLVLTEVLRQVRQRISRRRST
jgi:hypothetical protein